MKQLTPFQQARLKEIILHHVQGEALEVSTFRLKAEAKALAASAFALYEGIPLEPNDAFLNAIFLSLNLSASAKVDLLTRCDNLHDLLLTLHREGQTFLKPMLTLIRHTKAPQSKVTSALAVAGLAGFGAISYQQGFLNSLPALLKTAVSKSSAYFSNTAALVKNLPLLGMGLASAQWAYRVRKTLLSDSKSTLSKLASLLMTTLSLSLLLTGLSLLYLVPGQINPLIGGLLAASSGVRALKALVNWLTVKSTPAKPSLSLDNWQTRAQTIREAHQSRQAGLTFLVKLGSTLLTTTLLATASLFPLTAILSVACLSLMVVTALIEQGVLTAIKKNGADTLQVQLRAIDLAPDASLCPSTHPTALNLNRLKEELTQQGLRLNAQEASLRQREEVIGDTLLALAKGGSSPAQALIQLGGRKDKALLQAANEEMDNGEQQPQIIPIPQVEDRVDENHLQEEEGRRFGQQQ